MDIYEQVEVQDCPICGGASILEEECRCGYYVMCMDCGAHTVVIDFKKEEDKLDAAKRAAHLWNIGKAIPMEPGE